MKPDNSNQFISRKKNARNWLDLPREIWIQIFINLGTFYVLHTAQNVCSLWREISKEPQIFRCIEIPDFGYLNLEKFGFLFDKIMKEALNRCTSGELAKFSVQYFCTTKLLKLVVAKSRSSLRSLRIANYYSLSQQSFMKIIKTNPMLDEIHLSLCCFNSKTIGKIGRSCKHLKSFSLTFISGDEEELMFRPDDLNEEAYAIANTMPGLHRLNLFGGMFDNKGLQAILDKCLHLEYLDLRRCFRIDSEGDVMKKCIEKIRKIRLPNDPVDDNEFRVAEDFDHPSDMRMSISILACEEMFFLG